MNQKDDGAQTKVTGLHRQGNLTLPSHMESKNEAGIKHVTIY